jgi:hypothetical protein
MEGKQRRRSEEKKGERKREGGNQTVCRKVFSNANHLALLVHTLQLLFSTALLPSAVSRHICRNHFSSFRGRVAGPHVHRQIGKRQKKTAGCVSRGRAARGDIYCSCLYCHACALT